MRRRLTVWKKLGSGDEHSQDNYSWCETLDIPGTLMGETSHWVPADECCESMPYGHHQIGVFHP